MHHIMCIASSSWVKVLQNFQKISVFSHTLSFFIVQLQVMHYPKGFQIRGHTLKSLVESEQLAVLLELLEIGVFILKLLLYNNDFSVTIDCYLFGQSISLSFVTISSGQRVTGIVSGFHQKNNNRSQDKPIRDKNKTKVSLKTKETRKEIV